MTEGAMISMTGRRVIVTGAAGGLGTAAVKLFAALGARLLVTDLMADALHPEIVARAERSIGADLSSESGCDDVVAAALDGWDGIDGLFHCAGIGDVLSPAVDVDIDDWQRVMDIDLRGTFLIARAVGRVMTRQHAGSIALISSAAGLNPLPLRNAYSPAKAAVGMLGQVLASEWGPQGVRVNVIAPGYIGTEAMRGLPERGGPSLHRLEARTPLGRLGRGEEIARVGAFLLTEWSSFMTGAVLPVDGGWTAFGGAGTVAEAIRLAPTSV